MKNKVFAIGLLSIFFACNQSDKKQAGTQDSTKQDSTATVNNVELKDSKKAAIFNAYLSLKDALASTNAKEAAVAAKVLEPLLATDKGGEKDATFVGEIAKSNDIEKQRVQFTALSTDLIALFKKAELTSGTIYVQHCPMANKGDGGDWLSVNKEIKNPYYGNKMLTCGAVVEEIKNK